MRKAGVAALPVAAGLFLMAITHTGGTDNPVLFLRVDLGTFASFCLVLAGLVAGAVLLVRGKAVRQSAAGIVEAQRRGEEMHRQFIRRLDHEMKNPLTAARAALANLDAGVGSGANGAENAPALTSLHTQIDRLARLTTDLRKLTDLETRPIEMGPVDIGQLLTELAEEANETPGCCPQHVDLNLPSLPWPLPHVNGDWDLIYLACHNLLNNARKFCGPDARIQLRAFEDGPSVAVEVADTGPGICEEDLPHLGEELYRGRAAIGVEGSGLGLALVRAIAHRHGGSMAVRSRVGKGTVVTLRLPVSG